MAPVPAKILVVDDNRDQAFSLAELLELVGYESRFACSGFEGLSEARSFRPDVCVLDINMPGMNGCDLARHLRTELGGRVVLIAMTAVTGGEHDRRVCDAGFDMRFAKPCDPDVLLRAIEAVVAPLARAEGRP